MSSRINKIFVYSFAQFINVFISFLLSPYLSRALEKGDYAIYNQALYLGGFSTILFSFGLFNVVNYFFVKNDSHNEQNTIQSFILFLGVITTLIFYFSSFLFNNPKLAEIIRIYSLSFLFTFPINFFNTILIINNKAKYVAYCSIIVALINAGGLFIAIQKFHSIISAFYIIGIIVPLLNFFLLFNEAKKYIFKKFIPIFLSFKKVIKISGPLYLTNILGASYIYVSAFFVSVFAGDIAFANYRNGAIELPFISTIAVSVSTVIMPDIAKLYNEHKLEEIFYLKKKIINQLIYLIYPIVFYFLIFHREFIVSYFSFKYKESAEIFAIYACICFVRVNDYQDVLVSTGNTKYIFRSNLYYSVLNIFLVMVFGFFF